MPPVHVSFRTSTRSFPMSNPELEPLPRRVFACSFESAVTFDAMRARLEEAGPWRWTVRSNDDRGDYLIARALTDPDHGYVKIFDDAGRFIANVNLESKAVDAVARFEAVRTTLFERVLPALGAQDIQPTRDIE